MNRISICKTLMLLSALLIAAPGMAEEKVPAAPDTTLCEQGKAQSPIALLKADKAKLPLLEPDYKEVEMNIERQPGLLAVHYPEGSILKIGDQSFQLTRVTFHTPAEHTMRGQKFDLEVQLEHKNTEGKIAIVSVMMKRGFSNYGLDALLKKIPKADTPEPIIIDGAFFSPQTLFPADLGYYHYTGSLTTPPCTEGVEWYVLKAYVELGSDQLTAFKKILGANARPMQNLEGRKVEQQ